LWILKIIVLIIHIYIAIGYVNSHPETLECKGWRYGSWVEIGLMQLCLGSKFESLINFLKYLVTFFISIGWCPVHSLSNKWRSRSHGIGLSVKICLMSVVQGMIFTLLTSMTDWFQWFALQAQPYKLVLKMTLNLGSTTIIIALAPRKCGCWRRHFYLW
jgi:hypothetical protein